MLEGLFFTWCLHRFSLCGLSRWLLVSCQPECHYIAIVNSVMNSWCSGRLLAHFINSNKQRQKVRFLMKRRHARTWVQESTAYGGFCWRLTESTEAWCMELKPVLILGNCPSSWYMQTVFVRHHLLLPLTAQQTCLIWTAHYSHQI